jgi:hypothetical protein
VKLSELQIFELNTLVQKVTNGHAEGKPPLSDKDLYNFVDSQAALRRLQNILSDYRLYIPSKLQRQGRPFCCLTHLSYRRPEGLLRHNNALQNNKVHLTRVPGHREIQGNEHADKLTRTGLGRKTSNPFTSLSYLKRKAEEDVLATWKQE